jgi:hypothetical protein
VENQYKNDGLGLMIGQNTSEKKQPRFMFIRSGAPTPDPPTFTWYWPKVQYRRFTKFANTISSTVRWRDSNAMDLSYEKYFSVRRKNVLVSTRRRRKEMGRTLHGLLVAGSLLVALNISSAPGQVPDGTVKIISRMVAPGIGLSWGEGVLTYKGRDYPFTFKATGLFRDLDTKIAAAELSGQVFDLKKPEDFSGNYQKVETQTSEGGAGSRATIRNQNGVVVNLVSTMEGRKFALAREGMDIELKK